MAIFNVLCPYDEPLTSAETESNNIIVDKFFGLQFQPVETVYKQDLDGEE